jgi:hypothetical protein
MKKHRGKKKKKKQRKERIPYKYYHLEETKFPRKKGGIQVEIGKKIKS